MTSPDDPVHAFIALGGNLGDVEITLAEALWAIDALPQTTIRSQSSFYRTPAWGNTAQPDFINAAVEVRTRMPVRVLMGQLLEIEKKFGRVRSPGDRWGPRTLDLDILMFGTEIINEPGLQLPHPRLHERAFVLVPLAEIAPALEIPGHGRVRELLAPMDVSAIEPIS